MKIFLYATLSRLKKIFALVFIMTIFEIYQLQVTEFWEKYGIIALEVNAA